MTAGKTNYKRTYNFTISIKADDIYEAQAKAKELFGEKIFNEEVSWEQVPKPPKTVEPLKRDEFSVEL